MVCIGLHTKTSTTYPVWLNPKFESKASCPFPRLAWVIAKANWKKQNMGQPWFVSKDFLVCKQSTDQLGRLQGYALPRFRHALHRLKIQPEVHRLSKTWTNPSLTNWSFLYQAHPHSCFIIHLEWCESMVSVILHKGFNDELSVPHSIAFTVFCLAFRSLPAVVVSSNSMYEEC